MTDKPPVDPNKRASKSQRTYVRRLKQAAREAGLPYYRPSELPALHRPEVVRKPRTP
jgi:hypothetical protein